MKRILTLLLCLVTGQAWAWEIRGGLDNVQVRDRIYDEYGHGQGASAWDSDKLGWRFMNTFGLRASVPVVTDWEALIGIRLGGETGQIEGLASNLRLYEPMAGAKWHREFDRYASVYAQGTVSVPIMNVTFATQSKEASSTAYFPMAGLSAGAIYYPNMAGHQFGVGAEVGYSSPAGLEFQVNKTYAGDLNYGGVQYGIFFVIRPKLSMAGDKPVPKLTDATPKKADAPVVQPAPLAATTTTQAAPMATTTAVQAPPFPAGATQPAQTVEKVAPKTP